MIYEYKDKTFSLFSYELLHNKYGEDIQYLSHDCGINYISNKLKIFYNKSPLRFVYDDTTKKLLVNGNKKINVNSIISYYTSGNDILPNGFILYNHLENEIPTEIGEYRTAFIVLPGYMGSELFYNGRKIFGPNLYEFDQISGNGIAVLNFVSNLFEKLYFHEQNYLYPERTNKPKYNLNITDPIVFTSLDQIIPNEPYYQYTKADMYLFANDNICYDITYMTTSDYNSNKEYLGSFNIYCPIVKKLVDDKLKVETIGNGETLTTEIVFFSYDWRNFSNLAVIELENFVNRRTYIDVKFIAHSFGGYVVADYLANSNQNLNKTKQVHILGTPFEGAPLVLALLENGNPDHFLNIEYLPQELQTFLNNIFVRWYIEDKIRSLVENLPSIYQLIPTKRYFDNSSIEFLSQWFIFEGWRKYNFYESYNILSDRSWAKYISGTHEEAYECSNENGEPSICYRTVNEYSTKDLWNKIADLNGELVNKYYKYNNQLTNTHIIKRVNQYYVYLGKDGENKNTESTLRLNSFGLYDHMGRTEGDGITPYEVVNKTFGNCLPIKDENSNYISISHMDFISLWFYEEYLKNNLAN
ncbi:TPA: hypothetical protein GXZ54_00845 [bacterium]|nr:hypothetical protein [bacterium]